MTKSFKLVLQSGPNAGIEFPLEKQELYLGRDVNNDIVVNDAEVSRRHARFVRQGDNYYYEDLGSTNGTFILGQRLTAPALLQPGTTITIGERVLLGYIVEANDPFATVAAPRRAAPDTQRPPTSFVPPPQAAQPGLCTTTCGWQEYRCTRNTKEEILKGCYGLDHYSGCGAGILRYSLDHRRGDKQLLCHSSWSI